MFSDIHFAKIKELEGELARAQAMETALQRSCAMIEFAPDGRILLVNDIFCQAMGFAADELVGRHHRLLCSPEFVASAEYANFWKRLHSGEFFRGTVCRRRKDGQDVWLETSYNPMRDRNGQVQRVIVVVTGVTVATERQQPELETA